MVSCSGQPGQCRRVSICGTATHLQWYMVLELILRSCWHHKSFWPLYCTTLIIVVFSVGLATLQKHLWNTEVVQWCNTRFKQPIVGLARSLDVVVTLHYYKSLVTLEFLWPNNFGTIYIVMCYHSIYVFRATGSEIIGNVATININTVVFIMLMVATQQAYHVETGQFSGAVIMLIHKLVLWLW